jgi:hypothetical protein
MLRQFYPLTRLDCFYMLLANRISAVSMKLVAVVGDSSGEVSKG